MLGRRKGREMQLWSMSHGLRDPGMFHFSMKVQSLSPVWNTAVNLKGGSYFVMIMGHNVRGHPGC